MNKQNVVSAYNGILFSHEKEIFDIYSTTWLDLENIMLK